jgi:hypothetical protein
LAAAQGHTCAVRFCLDPGAASRDHRQMKAIFRRWHTLPKLIRFVIVNSLTGVVIGWLIAAGLIWFNIGGFGDRFDNAQNKLAVIFLLAGSFGVTFGFAFLTTSVLLLPTDKDDFDRV